MKLNLLKVRTYSKPIPPEFKRNCTLNLTGWATCDSSNGNEMFAITCGETFTTLEDFWPTLLGWIVLQQVSHTGGFPSMKVLPQHLNRIQVRTF